MQKNTLIGTMKFGALSMLAALTVSTLPVGMTAQAAEPMNRGIETSQAVSQSAWREALGVERSNQDYTDKEAVAYISKSSGDIVNPYKEIYGYIAEVKGHPPSADREEFIAAVRQSLSDEKITLGEYVFIQTKYAEYENKTWKLRLMADLAKQKKP